MIRTEGARMIIASVSVMESLGVDVQVCSICSALHLDEALVLDEIATM